MGSVLLPPPRARAPRRPAREPAFHLRICVGVCPGGREGAGARGAARGRATGEVCSRSPLPGPAALRAAANRAGRGGSLAVASHAPWCADTQARLVPPPMVGVGQRPKSCLTGWAAEAQERNFSLLARSWSSSPPLPIRWHLHLRPGARSGPTLGTREEKHTGCVHWGSVSPRPSCCQWLGFRRPPPAPLSPTSGWQDRWTASYC